MATKLTKKVTAKVKPVIKPKVPKVSVTKIKNFTQAVGRRKSATAKARVFEGKQV